MIRILHIGDVHLDKPFIGWKPQTGKILRRGVLDTFLSAVDTAIHRDVDLLILAGDICDQETMMPQTAYYFSEAMNRALQGGCQVLMITGNHDPWKGYAHLPYCQIPKGVMIANAPQMMHWNCVSKNGVPFQVVACGHDEKGISEPVVQTFVNKHALPQHPSLQNNETCPVIGAAHAAIIGMHGEVESGHMPYMPITIEKIQALHYDYFALGHIHQAQQWHQGRIAYSGSLQGLSADETGQHGGWLIECHGSQFKNQFISLGAYTFEKYRVSCDGIETVESLMRTIKGSVDAQEQKLPGMSCLLTVYLSGRSHIKSWIVQSDQLLWLEETLTEILGVLEVRVNHDSMKSPIEIENYLHTDTFLGELLRKTEAADNVETLFNQLENPFLTPFKNEIERKQFVRETLEQCKEQLIELFVGDVNEN